MRFGNDWPSNPACVLGNRMFFALDACKVVAQSLRKWMSSQEQMEIGKGCAYVATLFLGCFYTTLGQVQGFNFVFVSWFAKTIAPEQKTYQELNNLTLYQRSGRKVAGIGAASGIAGAGIFFLSTLVLLGHLVLTYVGCQLINLACGRRHGYFDVLHFFKFAWLSNDQMNFVY